MVCRHLVCPVGDPLVSQTGDSKHVLQLLNNGLVVRVVEATEISRLINAAIVSVEVGDYVMTSSSLFKVDSAECPCQ